MIKKPQVFISYSHSAPESEWVREFARALQERGVHVWLDVDEIAPGEPLRDAIENALRNSDAIIAVIDPESSRRPDLFFEIGAALGMGKRIIPIVSADVSTGDVPSALRNRKFLIRNDPRETANRVATAVSEVPGAAQGGI